MIINYIIYFLKLPRHIGLSVPSSYVPSGQVQSGGSYLLFSAQAIQLNSRSEHFWQV